MRTFLSRVRCNIRRSEKECSVRVNWARTNCAPHCSPATVVMSAVVWEYQSTRAPRFCSLIGLPFPLSPLPVRPRLARHPLPQVPGAW
jgi:hypothetical protein